MTGTADMKLRRLPPEDAKLLLRKLADPQQDLPARLRMILDHAIRSRAQDIKGKLQAVVDKAAAAKAKEIPRPHDMTPIAKNTPSPQTMEEISWMLYAAANDRKKMFDIIRVFLHNVDTDVDDATLGRLYGVTIGMRGVDVFSIRNEIVCRMSKKMRSLMLLYINK
jgi:hypothetical protein